MKQIYAKTKTLLLLLTLLTLGAWNNGAWAGDCTYGFTKNTENTSINNSEVIYQATINGTYYGLSKLTFKVSFSRSLSLTHNESKDLTYDIYLYNNSSKTWSKKESKTLEGYGTGNSSETITYTTDLTNISAFKVVSTTDFGSYKNILGKKKYTYRSVSVSSVSFVKASSVSASPTSLDFGSVTYGSNKSETVTATYMLSVSGDMTVSCTGDFSATISGSCDCVNSHQTKTITVTFTPSKAGTRSGTLTISNPDGTSTSVSLTGTGKRQDQTLTMANGQVNATTDKSNPTRLDLSTLCTQVGNGTVTYALVEAPTALDGTSAADSYVINGKYFHAWVAGTYTLSASASKTDQYNATTSPQQFTVTVNRVNNTLSLYKTVDARYVEETVNNAVSTNSNATINWSTSDGSLAYYDVAQNKIFIPNSNNQSFDTKVVTLKVWQDATDVYASGEKTLTLTVKKYDNTIVIAGFDDNDHVEHQIKTDWYDNELTISASNTDYAHYPINNDRTQGDDTQASFGRQEGTTDKWVVYTAQNTGIVRWRLWQEENYKYKAGDTTFAVNVIAPPCGCVLNEWHWEDGLFTNPPTASEIDSLGFGGIGETITFDARSNQAAGNQLEYSFYTNGKWSSSTKTTTESMLYYNTVGPITLGTGDQNTTAVRFHNSGLWLTTDDPFIRDIVVTRKRWMKILDGAGKSAKEITSLPTMERFIDEDAKVATFYVDFSTCDKLVKVASDYGHVTFSNNLDRDIRHQTN